MLQTSYHSPERRYYPRTHLQMSLRCVRLDPEGGDVVNTVHMTDISRGGLGAMADKPYYPGQRIVLTLPGLHGDTRRNIFATVIRCRSREEGYEVAMQFDQLPFTPWARQDINQSFAAA